MKLVKSDKKVCGVCGNIVDNTYDLCVHNTILNDWQVVLNFCDSCLLKVAEFVGKELNKG